MGGVRQQAALVYGGTGGGPLPDWRRGQGAYLDMQETVGTRRLATVTCGGVGFLLPGVEEWV